MNISKRTHILFVTLFIVIVYAGSLKNDFAWDDDFLILSNPYIKSWGCVPKMFTGHLYKGVEMQSNFYRPLELISFTIDYSVWELNPFGYHLTSLLLHIINSALVYLILIAVSQSMPIAFITSLLFGICPAISGITYYIPARSDLLMAFFGFLSILLFIAYTEKHKKILYVLSMAAFAFSLLSKEMAVMLPLLLALEIFRKSGKEKSAYKALIPYATILSIYVILRATILNFARGTNILINFSFPATIPFWKRMLTDFKVIVLYLKILLVPTGLHMEWFIRPAQTIFQPDILCSIIGVVLLVLAIKKVSQAHCLILYGALWFVLGLMPVSNIYPVSVFFGEGWLYMPSVGFFIILSSVFENIVRPKMGRLISNILVALLLIYYALFTVSYGKVWKNSMSLFSNVLKYERHSPFIYLAYNNFAMAHYYKGDFKKSIAYCRKSISANPQYAGSYNNLGVVYVRMGRPVVGIKFFKKAIRIKKDYIEAYDNLAHAYFCIGSYDMATRVSKAALAIDRRAYKAYCNLGRVYWSKGELDKAKEFFKKACEIKPEYNEAHYCLGGVYAKTEDYKASLHEYLEALRFGLSGADFYNDLASSYVKNKKFKEAIDALWQSLKLNPHQSGPHNNLGNLYSMFGYFDLAFREYKMALAIEPDNQGMRANLTKTKHEWKEFLRKHRAKK